MGLGVKPGSVLYAWGFARCFKYSIEASAGDSLRGEVQHHHHFTGQDTEPQAGHVSDPGHRGGRVAEPSLEPVCPDRETGKGQLQQ